MSQPENTLSFISMPERNRKLILGLTGSYGSGKTTVAGIFRQHGARIIDADNIAHAVISPGQKAYKKIIHYFKKDILDRRRHIDRKRLAEIVFSDIKLLARLNKITHPEIIKVIKKEIAAVKSGLVILDAPLLMETGLHKEVDRTIVVKIKKRIQRKRLIKKYPKDFIDRIIKSQMPQEKKVRIADFIIDNSGNLTQTRKQVEKIRRLLWRS